MTNRFRGLLGNLVIFLIPVLCAAVLLVFFQVQITVGCSMAPTVPEGSFTLCIRSFSPPEQGDVVLFRCADHLMMKRVIAVAGQSVQVDNRTGALWIDGVAQDDPFCAARDLDYAQEAWPGGYCGEPITVPDGYVFCLGDNRADSLDSRDAGIGMIPLSSIWGRLLLPSS